MTMSFVLECKQQDQNISYEVCLHAADCPSSKCVDPCYIINCVAVQASLVSAPQVTSSGLMMLLLGPLLKGLCKMRAPPQRPQLQDLLQVSDVACIGISCVYLHIGWTWFLPIKRLLNMDVKQPMPSLLCRLLYFVSTDESLYTIVSASARHSAGCKVITSLLHNICRPCTLLRLQLDRRLYSSPIIA